MKIAGWLRRSTLAVWLWLAGASLRAYPQGPTAVHDTKQGSLAAAQRALDDGKLDEAFRLFDAERIKAHAAKDGRLESESLAGVGKVWAGRNEYRKSIEAFSGALGLEKKLAEQTKSLEDIALIAGTLDALAKEWSDMDDYAAALDLYRQELVFRQQAPDKRLEAQTLSRIASELMALSRTEEALHSHEAALAIFKALDNKRGQAIELDEIGSAQDEMSNFEAAVEFHERALALSREIKDRANEGYTLGALAGSNSALGNETKSAALLMEAIQIARETKNIRYEAFVRDRLGNSYFRTGLYEKAIDEETAALKLAREAKARRSAAEIQIDMAEVYNSLNQTARAIELTQETLATCKEIGETNCVAVALARLGSYFERQGEFAKAVEADRQALELAESIKDRQGAAEDLTNLGVAQEHSKQMGEAVATYTQALRLSREIKDRTLEQEALYRLGSARVAQGEFGAGGALLEEALVVERAVKKPQQEARTLASLADLCAVTHRPELAVFFGKQAVNTLQGIRASNGGLNAELRQSYLIGNSEAYHQLADRLMALGRLPEAQQILNLLKAEEYFEFVRRDAEAVAPEKRLADLTPEEVAWNARYQDVSGRVVAVAVEREGLLQKASLTEVEKARLTMLDKDYEVGNQGFEKFLDALSVEQAAMMKADAGAKARPKLSATDLRDTAAIQDTLGELGHGAVAIYTLAGENSFRAILVTPKVQKGYVVQVGAAELNRKIFAFRQALLEPSTDARPAGRALYDILVAPMAADLAQAHAATLMWSLDGALRYVPVAALYDGSKYLVESYRTVVFTAASTTHLKDAPVSRWDAAGFGVSRPLDGAPALPGVVTELRGIISDSAESKGIVPGEIRLDDAFTEASMREAIGTGKYDVLHIASHFKLAPGNDAGSFLLLGDGEHLTLTDLGVRLKGLFRGINLMTLSACDTGVGSTGRNGNEVEGFGVMAQRNGAKSVVASLWAVADTSTSLLMEDFYRNLAGHADTKIDALRKAQLALLRGAGGFTHPFYWAPFFMMGNWL